jgi:hypothetical protein
METRFDRRIRVSLLDFIRQGFGLLIFMMHELWWGFLGFEIPGHQVGIHLYRNLAGRSLFWRLSHLNLTLISWWREFWLSARWDIGIWLCFERFIETFPWLIVTCKTLSGETTSQICTTVQLDTGAISCTFLACSFKKPFKKKFFLLHGNFCCHIWSQIGSKFGRNVDGA